MSRALTSHSPADRRAPGMTEPDGAAAPGHVATAPSGSKPSPIHDAAAREHFLREARAL